MADRRVLIVDDDVEFAGSWNDQMEPDHHRMKSAHDAEDAGTAAETLAPQAAWVDIPLRQGIGAGIDLLETFQ